MVSSLAWLPACEDADDTNSGGTSGSSGSQTPQGSQSQNTSPQGNSSQSNPGPSNAPPSSSQTEPPALTKAELVGTWEAPVEDQNGQQVRYSFTLNADGTAMYATTTYGAMSATTGAGPGTWDLGGTTLILISPTPETDGHGAVQNKSQVTINGRTFTKQ